MATVAVFPKFRAFDSDGNPLSGGLLYSYSAGTTTAKATYTDSSGGTANANPVVLDANGEANVWLTTGAYKLVLKSSGGVTQWTVDNITGATDLTTSSTSTTSLTIGTGSKTLLTQAAKSWAVGMYVVVASTATPTNLMHGVVTAYDVVTGSMTVSVGLTAGSGTIASWTISLSAPQATSGVLGSLSLQDADAVNITGGTLDGVTVTGSSLAGTDGGVVGVTAAAATNNTALATNAFVQQELLGVVGGSLPAQSGNAGKFLQTDGTTPSWQSSLPAQSGNANKVLTTDGSISSWSVPLSQDPYAI